jgi:hypothetical protein
VEIFATLQVSGSPIRIRITSTLHHERNKELTRSPQYSEFYNLMTASVLSSKSLSNLR